MMTMVVLSLAFVVALFIALGVAVSSDNPKATKAILIVIVVLAGFACPLLWLGVIGLLGKEECDA